MEKVLIGEESIENEQKQQVFLKYYILTETKYYEELQLEMPTYGIEIQEVKNKITDFERVYDITNDREKIKQIVRQIKSGKVFPVHLKDIILDLIGF